MASSNGNMFPRYWPFVRGIYRSPAGGAELWCFLWSTPEKTAEQAIDFRRHCADYDVTLMGEHTVYPKKYAHGFVVLCVVVVMQSFIMNSREVFIHIHQGCFAGTGAIVRLPQCQWSKPDRYGKISECITTTKHSKAKTVCIFLGIYCICWRDTQSRTSYLCEQSCISRKTCIFYTYYISIWYVLQMNCSASLDF